MSNKIWYLPGPFHRYQEDVKVLAREAGLRIIDANVTAIRDDAAEDVPTVTVKTVARSEPESPLVVGTGQASLDQKELIGKLQAESDAIRVLIESTEGLTPLEHPEAGELPIRLFDALSGIHQGIAGIKAERDSLSTENESLRGEVTSLKAAASKSVDDSAEIEALKAALDAAKVSYRANASKDALEKLVAELPKE
ncbi:hypothetical protein [Pseudomonas sp. D1HM]|uniref:hypothetical protein n=1 Tax=Pseudomonas sp. D1HM TaxID=1784816 RepID=UPI001C4E6C1C|nr:hypothetical protein [Pseudomonas sp. D1HM]MBW0236344.1 hypothetical protein [Pseudomonas sp. D1HM]